MKKKSVPPQFWQVRGAKRRHVCTCASCCKLDPTRLALRKDKPA